MGAVVETVKEALRNPAYIRKGVTALVTTILSLVGAKLLPDAVAVWIYSVQPVLVFLGVVIVPNAPAVEVAP